MSFPYREAKPEKQAFTVDLEVTYSLTMSCNRHWLAAQMSWTYDLIRSSLKPRHTKRQRRRSELRIVWWNCDPTSTQQKMYGTTTKINENVCVNKEQPCCWPSNMERVPCCARPRVLDAMFYSILKTVLFSRGWVRSVPE